MIQIKISEEVARACPDLHVLAITCRIQNSPSDPHLWEEIACQEETIRKTFQIEDINKWPPVRSTREAYKKLGKDPNRYRPSAESLYRRVVRGLPLYRIDTLVDTVNLISLKTGYSIGAFDMDKIEGEQLVLGVGREGEVYHGIGRGELNISGLPVYRDRAGGIGTPTSDEERTKIELSTTRLLMLINGYSGVKGLSDASAYSEKLLRKYLKADQVSTMLIKGIKE